MPKTNITINRAPSVVWEYFTDSATWGEWYGGGIKQIDPDWESGARIIWEFGEPSTIESVHEGREVVIAGSFMKTWYRFIPRGDEETCVEVEFIPRGGAVFTDGGQAKLADTRTVLARLKRLVEKKYEASKPVPVPATPVKEDEADYSYVKDKDGNVCGIWLRDSNKAQNRTLLGMLLTKDNLPKYLSMKVMEGRYRVVPNTRDKAGGCYVMFGDATAPGEKTGSKRWIVLVAGCLTSILIILSCVVLGVGLWSRRDQISLMGMKTTPLPTGTEFLSPVEVPETSLPPESPNENEIRANNLEDIAGVWLETFPGGSAHLEIHSDGFTNFEIVSGANKGYQDQGQYWFENDELMVKTNGIADIGRYKVYITRQDGRTINIRYDVIEDSYAARRDAMIYAPLTVVEMLNEPSTDIDWQPVVFNVPDAIGFWEESSEDSFTAIGLYDSFLWTEELYEGDLSISFDVEILYGNDEWGGGAVILFGDGTDWSKGNLIFFVNGEAQNIQLDTVYEGTVFLAYNDISLQDGQTYSFTIEILGNKASLLLDGEEIVSATLPTRVNRRGRIGLFKEWAVPEVTFSNLKVKIPGQ